MSEHVVLVFIRNKSVLSFLSQLKTWHFPHLHCAVVWLCSSQSVSPVCSVQRPHDGMDGQTDRQMPNSFIDPALHTM